MLIDDFINKYKNGISKELLQDKLTIEKLLRWENNVFPIFDFINISIEATRRLDSHIRTNTGHELGIRSTAWGELFDKQIADIMDEKKSLFRFRRCKNHNTERDVVCIDPRTKNHYSVFDVEVKSALNSKSQNGYHGFFTHPCKNINNSKKYKSLDEKNYYLLVQLDRDEELEMTFVGSIWFGRLSQNDWNDRYLKKEIRDKCCIKIK